MKEPVREGAIEEPIGEGGKGASSSYWLLVAGGKPARPRDPDDFWRRERWE
ncbi:hypothetical protein [Thermogemmatispora sp.]|uniref:hypothetical protein n=1 Tax=Thermogemmatispora sp. TaxID=1968838 RepID=UPI0035E45E67